MRRSFRTLGSGVRSTQGFTLGWYALPLRGKKSAFGDDRGTSRRYPNLLTFSWSRTKRVSNYNIFYLSRTWRISGDINDLPSPAAIRLSLTVFAHFHGHDHPPDIITSVWHSAQLVGRIDQIKVNCYGFITIPKSELTSSVLIYTCG